MGFLPAPCLGLYSASKHAVEGLSEPWTTRCVSSALANVSHVVRQQDGAALRMLAFYMSQHGIANWLVATVFECLARTLDIPRDFILAQLALANDPADVDLHTDDPLQQPDDSVENSRPLRELLFAAKKALNFGVAT